MVTCEDLDLGKTAALRCAYCAANVALWGSTQRALLLTGNHAIGGVRISGAEVFGDCVEAQAAAKVAITGEVRESLLLAAKGEGVPQLEVSGHRVSLWHDAAAAIAGGAFLLLLDGDSRFPTDDLEKVGFSLGELGVGLRLHRHLAALHGDGFDAAWRGLVDRAAAWDVGNYEAIFAGIEREWAAARAGKEDPPKPPEGAANRRHGKPRKRGTKGETSLKVQAAMVYKSEHPGAGDAEVTEAVKIPRSTLQGKKEWQEWCLTVEQAANNGKLDSLQATLDRRTGEIVAYREEPNTPGLT